jgi:hypothetical protein
VPCYKGYKLQTVKKTLRRRNVGTLFLNEISTEQPGNRVVVRGEVLLRLPLFLLQQASGPICKDDVNSFSSTSNISLMVKAKENTNNEVVTSAVYRSNAGRSSNHIPTWGGGGEAGQAIFPHKIFPLAFGLSLGTSLCHLSLSPFLFTSGVSCLKRVQTSLSQNCLANYTWFFCNCHPVSWPSIGLEIRPQSTIILPLGPSCPLQTILLSDLVGCDSPLQIVVAVWHHTVLG